MNDRQVQEWDTIIAGALISTDPRDTIRVSVGLVRVIDAHFIPANRRRLVMSEARTLALFFLAGFASCLAIAALAALLWYSFH